MTSEEIANWYKETTNELGIDLITLFKALKNGVYYVANGSQLTKDYVNLVDNYMSIGTRDGLSYSFITAHEGKTLAFNDYGKTWTLMRPISFKNPSRYWIWAESGVPYLPGSVTNEE